MVYIKDSNGQNYPKLRQYKMASEWITAKQLAQIRKCSERVIINRIKEGKLKAKRDGKRWLVLLDNVKYAQNTESVPKDSELIAQLKAENEFLRNELSKSREHTDTIILSLTQELRQYRLKIESKKPFWNRIFRNKHQR